MAYAVLFIAGLAQDIVAAMYVRAVSTGNRLQAALLAGAITLLSYAVFATILDGARGLGLAALCAGNVLGTFLSVNAKPPRD